MSYKWYRAVLTMLIGVAIALPSSAQSPAPVLAGPLPDVAPQLQERGYVSGIFSYNYSMYGPSSYYGFGLVNLDTKVETLMSFFDPRTPMRMTAPARLSMIELPPGRYRIAYWATYNMGFGVFSVDGKMHGASEDFEVKAGRIAFLGRYITEQGMKGMSVQTGLRELPVSMEDVVAHLIAAYPNFAPETIDLLHR